MCVARPNLRQFEHYVPQLILALNPEHNRTTGLQLAQKVLQRSNVRNRSAIEGNDQIAGCETILRIRLALYERRHQSTGGFAQLGYQLQKRFRYVGCQDAQGGYKTRIVLYGIQETVRIIGSFTDNDLRFKSFRSAQDVNLHHVPNCMPVDSHQELVQIFYSRTVDFKHKVARTQAGFL